MPTIKKQNIRYDSDFNIISGTAAVIETVYDPHRIGHSRKITRESLGKAIWIDSSGREGIFLSSTRGLVRYNADLDCFYSVPADDPHIASRKDLLPEPEVHTVLGDSFLLLSFMKSTGMLGILHSVFPKNAEYERCLCHILHTVLRNGAHKSCDDFIQQSYVSWLFDDVVIGTLESDSAYFSKMGDDSIRVSFFRQFVQCMRKKNPKFGSACYVDSTPLPNDIQTMVTNAFASHGTAASVCQTRMVLVLDEETNLPVWFSLIPGNVLDLQTLKKMDSDVLETLDVHIDSYVLDAGYLTKSVLSEFNNETKPYTDEAGNEHRRLLLAKMPARQGFPFHELYKVCLPYFHHVKYQFDRAGHTYFAAGMEIKVFDYPINAYVYLDFDNALNGIRRFRDERPDEYQNMSIEEKEWSSYRSGFFILLSNKKEKPEKILDEYFIRADIETYFKTLKDFTQLLPLNKWTLETINGKILNDIISSIAYTSLREMINKKNKAMTKLISKTQALMCTHKHDGNILVDPPSKQVREMYKDVGISVPSYIHTEKYKKETLLLHD